MPNLPSDLNPQWWHQNHGKTFQSELGARLEHYWNSKTVWLNPSTRCRHFHEAAQKALDNIQKTAKGDMSRCAGPKGAEIKAVLQKYANLSAVARGQIDKVAQEYKHLVDEWTSIRIRLLEAMVGEQTKMNALLKAYETAISTVSAMAKNEHVDTQKIAERSQKSLAAEQQKIDSEVLKIFATAKSSSRGPNLDDVSPEARGAMEKAKKIQEDYAKRRTALAKKFEEVLNGLLVAH